MTSVARNITSSKVIGTISSATETNRLPSWLLSLTFFTLLLGVVPAKRATTSLLLIYLLIKSLKDFHDLPRVAAKTAPLIILAALIAVSPLWSRLPSASFDAVASQLAFITLGYLIAYNFSAEALLKSLCQASAAYITIVIVYSAIFFGPSFTPDGLVSFTGSKNKLGGTLGLCTLILFFEPRQKLWARAACLASVCLLALTLSKTAIGATALAVCALMLGKLLARYFYMKSNDKLLVADVVRAAIKSVFIIGLMCLVYFRDECLAFVAHEMPKSLFTGRAILWHAVIQQIRLDSLLGVGPNVFWQAGGSSEIAQTLLFARDPYWVQRMVSADGSYIDVLGSYGVLGLALFIFCTGWSLAMHAQALTTKYMPSFLILFSYCIIHATTETTLMYSPNTYWLLYIILTLMAARSSVRQA